jgi:RNA polymerase sigma-70 factor (ECF subfamily)
MAQHESDLLTRAQQGDASAFAALYEQHSPAVCRFLQSRLAGSREAAEDVTTVVFVKVWQKLDTYEDRGLPLEAWIFRIARNCLIDHLRRQPPLDNDSLVLASDVPDNNSGSEYRQVLDRHILEAALARLGDVQRQAVTLRFIDGLSTLEAGEIMGRSEDAVKKLQARALINLRRLISAADVRPGARGVALAA